MGVAGQHQIDLGGHQCVDGLESVVRGGDIETLVRVKAVEGFAQHVGGRFAAQCRPGRPPHPQLLTLIAVHQRHGLHPLGIGLLGAVHQRPG